MAEKLDPNEELTSWQEISYANMVEQRALFSLLLEKGIITEKEYMDRVKLVHKEIQKMQGE
jgi:hypothetical protein